MIKNYDKATHGVLVAAAFGENFNIFSKLLDISADMVYNRLVVLVCSSAAFYHKKKTMSSLLVNIVFFLCYVFLCYVFVRAFLKFVSEF